MKGRVFPDTIADSRSRSVATLSRPGFQGMASSSVLTSGSMHSSSMVGMPSPVNMHSGVGTGPGNTILRPREPIHMMRVRNVPIASFYMF